MDQAVLKMNASEYKKYHESFMENNHGSSALHTFLCIFFTVQCTIFCCLTNKHSEPLQHVFEYTVIVLPLVLAHTVLAQYINLLNCLVLTILIIKIMYKISSLEISKTYASKNYFINNKVQSITCLRGLTYLITVFAILAVDFQSFPRYLAKTENYGYSLMDTGVGLFVLMSGLVYKDSRNEKITTVIQSNIKFITILFCLGVIRFISVKKLDYQEHVSEYGVHWNFFFTLAVCKVLSTIFLYYFPNALIISVIILICHECLLYSALEQWVFSDIPRTNLLNANREGLTSTLGYVSLYLFAAYTKSIICDKTVTRYKVQIKLLSLSVILSYLAYFVNLYRPTSRTLANASYCLYLQAVLLFILNILYFMEINFQNTASNFKVPVILLAINNNGLLYFLISNLITGTINLSIRTLSVPIFETSIILNFYMMLTICIVSYLKKKGIAV